MTGRQVNLTERDQLAAESAEERATRLQQTRDQLAAESVEEREARLQWISALQRRQLAVETDEKRRSITVCLRAVVTGVAVEQHSIQVKMKSFHVHFAHVNNYMKSCLRILDL